MTVGRLIRSIVHTPVPQLANRLRLKGKRMALVRLAGRFPERMRQQRIVAPTVSREPPPALLPQLDRARPDGAGGFVFDLLNHPRTFGLPIPWHAPELNVGTRLWKLHLHYFDYTSHLDDAAFQAVATDWIVHNRPFTEGYWLDSWNSYALSIRTVSWMSELATRGQRLDSEFRRMLETSLGEQIRFLHDNIEDDIGGNHIVKNIKALYWAGRFFTGRLAQRSRHLADRLLEPQIDRQVLPDGYHFERSPAYHCQVFGDLMDCWRMMDEGALRQKLGDALHRMAQVVADVTHPDGAVALFNDGGLEMSWSPGTLLSAYGALMARPAPVARPAAWLPDAGYFVWRDEAVYLMCDAGEVGPDGLPAHAHGDILAFEFDVGGHRLFVDAGVYEYNAGHRRSLSRATRMHNTVTLADQDQCEFWGSFRMGRRARVSVNDCRIRSDGFHLDAEHSGYVHLAGQPVHRRVMRLEQDRGLIVTDCVRGGAGQPAVARLLLSPEASASSTGPGAVRISINGWTVDLTSDCRTELVDSHWWPEFGVEVPTRAIELHYGQAPGEWSFSLRWSRPPQT